MHLTMGTIGMLPIGVLKDLLVAAGLSVKVTPVKLIHGARLGVVTVTVDGANGGLNAIFTPIAIRRRFQSEGVGV